MTVEAHGAEHAHEQQVLARHREDRAEEEREQARVERAGGRDQHDARRDARIEEQRERLVAGGLAARAQPLDRDRAEHRGHERGADRRDAEQIAERDSREGDVADAVADEAHPALHEEEPDRRREHADDRAGREGQPHEVGVKDGHGRGRATRRARQREGRRRRCRPRTSTSRSTNCSTAPNSCETKRIDVSSSSCSSASSAASDSCASTSTPAVGSSSTSRSGSPASAFAMNARCCWPPESVRHGLRRPLGEPHAIDRGRDERAVVGAQAPEGTAPRDASRGHDLLHGHRRLDSELRTLGEIADAVALAEAAGGLAEERCRSRLRLLEPEQDAQQRRLAAAVRAGHRDELALVDGEVDVAKHRRPARIGEAHALQLGG